MKHTNHHLPLEPKAFGHLFGSNARKQPSGVDKGFRYRNIFLIVAGLFFVVRLLFFPATTASPFNIPTNTFDPSKYMQLRGIVVVSLFFIYAASYTKDWFFEKTSLVIATFTLTALVMDYLNIYTFVQGTLPPVMILGIFLRIGAIYCLFMNAMRDNRAPAMPRHLFS